MIQTLPVVATLLLVFVFLLSVFILAQFFLGQEVTSKDTVMTRLNAQIAELTELLSLERSDARDLGQQLASLQASLNASEGERDRGIARAKPGASSPPA